jgi:uncharacterized iron-regulated membrane protein
VTPDEGGGVPLAVVLLFVFSAASAAVAAGYLLWRERQWHDALKVPRRPGT